MSGGGGGVGGGGELAYCVSTFYSFARSLLSALYCDDSKFGSGPGGGGGGGGGGE